MILKAVHKPRMVAHADAAPTWVVPCILETEHPAFVAANRFITVPVDNDLASEVTFALLRDERVLIEVEARRRH